MRCSKQRLAIECSRDPRLAPPASVIELGRSLNMNPAPRHSWREQLLYLFMAVTSIVILGYGSLLLASYRTGGIPLLQFVVLFFGVPSASLLALLLALMRHFNARSAVILSGSVAAIFLISAFLHTRYGTAQTLSHNGFKVRVETEYSDPFDYYVASWRNGNEPWSDRVRIGDSLGSRGPFSLSSEGTSALNIVDAGARTVYTIHVNGSEQ